MIKYNVDKKLGIPMYLIYSNSDSEFVFKNELDLWQKENDLESDWTKSLGELENRNTIFNNANMIIAIDKQASI